jgi:hypothetical protein
MTATSQVILNAVKDLLRVAEARIEILRFAQDDKGWDDDKGWG